MGKPTMTSAIERPGDARMAAPIETPPVCSKCPAQSGRNEPVQKSDFDPGWDLPERRKFRYRLQDIAF
nr:hypothetical protein [uncultured Duganella sp.]